MPRKSRNTAKTCVAAAALLVGAASMFPVTQQAQAREPGVYTGLIKGVAVGGYDAVAYFTDGKPVPGNAEFNYTHAGAAWRFVSAANRDAFIADPARYAPQYGGYCAWAVSQGYTAKGDPNAWSVVNGKLYLNYNADVKKGWEKAATANIVKGDANWPVVLDKPRK